MISCGRCNESREKVEKTGCPKLCTWNGSEPDYSAATAREDRGGTSRPPFLGDSKRESHREGGVQTCRLTREDGSVRQPSELGQRRLGIKLVSTKCLRIWAYERPTMCWSRPRRRALVIPLIISGQTRLVTRFICARG